MMMAYVDGELSEDDRSVFEKHLTACEDCSKEMAEFEKLKRLTDSVEFVEPEDRIWDQYWSSVYNRMERGLGWAFFSVAAILLTIYGGFRLIEQIIADPKIGFLLKAGMLVLLAGLAILFVSVLRERVYFWSKDRYRDVRR